MKTKTKRTITTILPLIVIVALISVPRTVAQSEDTPPPKPAEGKPPEPAVHTGAHRRQKDIHLKKTRKKSIAQAVSRLEADNVQAGQLASPGCGLWGR